MRDAGWALVLIAALLVCAAGSARADNGDAASPASDEAWRMYDAAFVALSLGDRSSARDLLRTLIAQKRGHPAALLAAARLGELSQHDAAPALRDRIEPDDRGADKHTRLARAELTFWMTVSGVLLARDICEARGDCSSNREWAATLMLSSGSGLGLSLLASHRGITQGQTQLYNSSLTWGSWNALGLNDGFAEGSDEARVAIAAQAAGLGLGLGLWKVWRPSEGDVSLTNTVGVWGTVLALLAHGIAEEEPTMARTAIIGDVGLVAGALLSTQANVSRGRTLLIDVGGILGFLAGGLVAVGADDEQTGFTALFVGTAAGLGIAAATTKDWDAPSPPTTARLIPARIGTDGWGAMLSFSN